MVIVSYKKLLALLCAVSLVMPSSIQAGWFDWFWQGNTQQKTTIAVASAATVALAYYTYRKWTAPAPEQQQSQDVQSGTKSYTSESFDDDDASGQQEVAQNIQPNNSSRAHVNQSTDDGRISESDTGVGSGLLHDQELKNLNVQNQTVSDNGNNGAASSTMLTSLTKNRAYPPGRRTPSRKSQQISTDNADDQSAVQNQQPPTEEELLDAGLQLAVDNAKKNISNAKSMTSDTVKPSATTKKLQFVNDAKPEVQNIAAESKKQVALEKLDTFLSKNVGQDVMARLRRDAKGVTDSDLGMSSFTVVQYDADSYDLMVANLKVLVKDLFQVMPRNSLAYKEWEGISTRLLDYTKKLEALRSELWAFQVRMTPQEADVYPAIERLLQSTLGPVGIPFDGAYEELGFSKTDKFAISLEKIQHAYKALSEQHGFTQTTAGKRVRQAGYLLSTEFGKANYDAYLMGAPSCGMLWISHDEAQRFGIDVPALSEKIVNCKLLLESLQKEIAKRLQASAVVAPKAPWLIAYQGLINTINRIVFEEQQENALASIKQAINNIVECVISVDQNDNKVFDQSFIAAREKLVKKLSKKVALIRLYQKDNATLTACGNALEKWVNELQANKLRKFKDV